MLRAILVLLMALFALPSVAAPSCLPGMYGPQWPDAKNEPWARGQHGWYAYGWCKGDDGAPKRYYLICAHGLDCPTWDTVGIKMGSLGFEAQNTSKQAAYGAWWDQAVGSTNYCDPATLVADTPKKRACDELMALMERDKPEYTPPAPPPVPPAYTHSVAPNPQSTAVPPTRPSRQVVDGVLKTMTKPVYVPVGTDCDTSVLPTFPSGSDVWATVVGQPTNLRWLCRAK